MTTKVLDYIPEELIANTPQSDVIAPCFDELNELARIDDIDKRVIVVYDEHGVLTGCAVCNVETRRHHGLKLRIYSLFGYLLHDYSRILCTSLSTMKELKKTAIIDAKKNGCDTIIWSNIPAELVPNGSLPTHSKIKIFDAGKSEQGWARFYKSKHVKYLINRAKKIFGDYHVEVIDGHVPNDVMDEIADLHIFRWRFAGSDSPFSSNPVRKDEYRAHPSNKHFLRILVGDEVVACHYGMRYGKSLLFHTPIINPKYLELSPMKLILAETAKYCESNHMELLDFGHGDEAYKDGYCTLPRYTCNYEKAISAKGFLASMFGFLQNLMNIKIIKNVLSPRLKNNDIAQLSVSNTAIPKNATVISSWTDFCDFCKVQGLPIHKWQYDKFRGCKSIVFVAIMENKKCVDSFWKDDQGVN